MPVSISSPSAQSVRLHESRPSPTPWLMHFIPQEKRGPKIICLPHAGSGAAGFKTLAGHFFRHNELLVVQYPGRETRMRTSFSQTLHQLADEITEVLGGHIDEPYILFGHSMGSKVAYEVALRLQAKNQSMPQRLFVSCGPAPWRPSGLNPAFRENDQTFLAYLKRLGGVPDELLAIPDLVDMILPILRADFELLYTYQPDTASAPLSCPLTAIGSPQDASVSEDAMQQWQDVAGRSFSYLSLEGGHFYFPKQARTFDQIYLSQNNHLHPVYE